MNETIDSMARPRYFSHCRLVPGVEMTKEQWHIDHNFIDSGVGDLRCLECGSVSARRASRYPGTDITNLFRVHFMLFKSVLHYSNTLAPTTCKDSVPLGAKQAASQTNTDEQLAASSTCTNANSYIGRHTSIPCEYHKFC